MPTICTCKQRACKVIMREHYPCSVPCQFFLFPVLRHSIGGDNLHHPHMPSADVYSNKSSMWLFFTSSCASENNPKSHTASVHSHTHMVFFLGALPTCSLFHARGLLEWSLCSLCPAHPSVQPIYTNWADNPISWNISFIQFSFMSSESLNSNWLGHDCS